MGVPFDMHHQETSESFRVIAAVRDSRRIKPPCLVSAVSSQFHFVLLYTRRDESTFIDVAQRAAGQSDEPGRQ